MTELLIVISIFVFITGACIGSFLNVVALRALSGESIVFPSSKCPLCNEPVKWYDNIPVISYLFTVKGKCRNCGGKISVQYPIVEALTALIFLGVFSAYGISWQTLLLLAVICCSIVIIITDLKNYDVFERHVYTLIILALGYSLYTHGLKNYEFPVIGLITGAVVTEAIARLSYFLIGKKENTEETAEEQQELSENQTSSNPENIDTTKNNEEIIDINEYVKKNKRTFGEGDTLIAAASGALLGWKVFLITLFFSFIFHSLFILPQLFKKFADNKAYKLTGALSAFFGIYLIFVILSGFININSYFRAVFAVIMAVLGVYCIRGLKEIGINKGFQSQPFGPSLLISTFLFLFFGKYILYFINSFIF